MKKPWDTVHITQLYIKSTEYLEAKNKSALSNDRADLKHIYEKQLLSYQ